MLPSTSTEEREEEPENMLPDLPESELFHIHFIAHSHDDVGWLKSPKDYFDTQVRFILTGVVDELGKKEHRKFSWTEIYYFERWWNMQNESTREDVRVLVKKGQLEFVNGGWASSDEACPTYEELIVNIMTGHAFL